MSRNILNDHPWDKNEIQYHVDRGLFSDIEQNQKDYPPGSEVVEPEDDSDGVTLELSQAVYEHVQGLSVDQLKAELKKSGLKPAGDETALKVRLAQHLQDLEDRENASHA